jgi:predicted AlkP superfamily phosphohydrolase/phosphomutase
VLRSLPWLPLAVLAVLLNVGLAGEGIGRLASGRTPAPAPDAATIGRFVVLGFDGVDPRILEEYLAADALPALKRLVATSGLHPLQSEIPPESPVAWSSLLTGVNPGRHGIFDFVARDPQADTGYRPTNGMLTFEPARLLLGKVPVRPPRLTPRLAYPTFLERVAAAGYPVLSLRQPIAFPAKPTPGATMLAGLGTPDLAGSNGLYALYNSDPLDRASEFTVFDGHRIHLEGAHGATSFDTVLEGPFDRTRRDATGGHPRLTIPLRFERTLPDGPVTVVVDGRRVAVAAGGQSPWIRVRFTAPTWPPRVVAGRARFDVLRVDPLLVHSFPVQIDAAEPAFPISTPPGYAKELEDRYGPSKTQGWMEETFQLNDGSLSEEDFLKDLLQDMDHGAAVLLGELRRGARCAMYVFTQTDRAAHCFYRLRDAGHPAHDAATAARLGDPLRTVYERMDRIVGAVAASLAPADTLLVVSDHGFQTWRHGMNVNEWLRREGYLVAKDTRAFTLHDFFGDALSVDHVDWAKTRAYALGLGQIYVNVKGREPQGIVPPEAVDALVEEIATKVVAFQDDATKERPVRKVYRLRREYHGPKAHEAAEMQLAFGPGWRISWQTALLGGIGGKVCEDNLYPWSGDHCSTDRDLVPGILLSNRPLSPAPPSRPYHVRDVAATVLGHFHLSTADLDALPIPLAPGP